MVWVLIDDNTKSIPNIVLKLIIFKKNFWIKLFPFGGKKTEH